MRMLLVLSFENENITCYLKNFVRNEMKRKKRNKEEEKESLKRKLRLWGMSEVVYIKFQNKEVIVNDICLSIE